MYEWYMFLWLGISILFVFCFGREALRRRRMFIQNSIAQREANVTVVQGVRHHQMYVYSISTNDRNIRQTRIDIADDLPPKYEEVMPQRVTSQTVK